MTARRRQRHRWWRRHSLTIVAATLLALWLVGYLWLDPKSHLGAFCGNAIADWQKGIALAKLVYGLTRTFPSEEKFGLIAQMRRAAVSVPSNIAEGQARHTTGEFIQFISHAEGSVAELDTQLILAVELQFCRALDASPLFELIDELRRILNALRRKLAAR